MQVQPSNWYHWSFSLELHLMLLEKNPGLVNRKVCGSVLGVHPGINSVLAQELPSKDYRVLRPAMQRLVTTFCFLS